MKVLVISDSHRGSEVVEEIIKKNNEIKHIFFLGDNTADIEDFKYIYEDKNFYIVSGNCDFYSSYPTLSIEKIGAYRIMYTHGHSHSVKDGLVSLEETAKKLECDIVFYGHTHISDISYKNGIYFVNPGSCRKSRNGHNSYAVVELSEKGILPSIIAL